MKPTKTWIVLANARTMRIVEHRGAGHGLRALPDLVLHADAPAERTDRAGVGHSIAGPAVSAVGQVDDKEQADEAFARRVVGLLEAACVTQAYDRLIIAAGPHMLGLLRKSYTPGVTARLLDELDKDLTHHPLEGLERHLEATLLI